MQEVTLLLKRLGRGDKAALDEIIPLVYAELRRIAQGYLRRELPGGTLQPTALIHEAYLRMVRQSHPDYASRAHFYGISARIMRQILVDHARGRHAQKRASEQTTMLSESLEVSGKQPLRPAKVTLPGRGCRFALKVEQVTEEGDEALAVKNRSRSQLALGESLLNQISALTGSDRRARAYEQHSPAMNGLNSDAVYPPIRSDPRFNDHRCRVELASRGRFVRRKAASFKRASRRSGFTLLSD